MHNPESSKSKPIWIVAILIGVILLLLLVVAIVLIRLGAVFLVSYHLSNRRHFLYAFLAVVNPLGMLRRIRLRGRKLFSSG